MGQLEAGESPHFQDAVAGWFPKAAALSQWYCVPNEQGRPMLGHIGRALCQGSSHSTVAESEASFMGAVVEVSRRRDTGGCNPSNAARI
eukprot:1708418-Alexandrium_andersonii.AAC.1